MTSFRVSAGAYEDWLRSTIGPSFVEADLEKKHEKMRGSAFAFLRGTYWRWAETILEICPGLADGPQVLAIGDTHLENFGTWRDVEGRLIWGANDFDDADFMPYTLDLVRLAASALLARDEDGPSASDITEAILEGYDRGLYDPAPLVLDRNHKWLRKTVVLPESERKDFWDKFGAFKHTNINQPYDVLLEEALPEGHGRPAMAPRSAGLGSLGRPRFVARCEWNGGPVLREAKRIVVSGWSHHHAPGKTANHVGTIATGRWRAPDPHYRVLDEVVLRRLSPSSRKIEAKDAEGELLSKEMLKSMGFEIGNCHADDQERLPSLQSHLSRLDRDWLRAAAKAAANAVEREYERYV